jgi:Gas vesicle protein K
MKKTGRPSRKPVGKTARPRAGVRQPRSSPDVPARTRLELDPDDMQRSLMRLLLSLAGFVRDLLERQTLRRLERKTLSAAEVERLGRALMQLEQTITDLARTFDLDPEELNLGLGPLGRLR